MSVVVGIDPSLTSCGIAVLRDGNAVMVHTLGHKGHNAASTDQRVARIESQVHAILRAVEPYAPDLWVVENLPLHSQNMGAFYDRYALFVGLWSQLKRRKFSRAEVNNQTRAKWATGKGNANKRAVLDAVQADWPHIKGHITNDNIADALTLAGMGAMHLGDSLPIPMTEWRLNGLEAVKWPEVVSA